MDCPNKLPEEGKVYLFQGLKVVFSHPVSDNWIRVRGVNGEKIPCIVRAHQLKEYIEVKEHSVKEDQDAHEQEA